MEQTNQWDATVEQLIVDLDDIDEVDLSCETVEDYIARFRSIAANEMEVTKCMQ